MIEAAKSQGAEAVINVRFETSDVGGQNSVASEILVYGTMVKA